MNLLVLAIVLGVVASAACAANAAPITSDIPLPNTYDGFVYPSRGAKDLGAGRGGVVIEAFFDLLCSDCKAAWPNIKKLMESYEKNSTTPAPALIVHTFPLPYHHNAFYGNQGAHVVASYASKARGKDVDSPAEGASDPETTVLSPHKPRPNLPSPPPARIGSNSNLQVR